MKKMRIVVCDNNPSHAQFYERLCHGLGQRHNVPVEVKSCPTGNDLLFDLENPVFKKRLDIVFYSLSAVNTVELAAQIREMGYAGLIILIGEEGTDVVLENLFDTEIFNFVRKGDRKEYIDRFEEVFCKAVRAVAKTYEEKLALSYAGEIRHIDISDIQYFEKQDRGINVYYGDGEKFYFISTITKLENQLKGKDFHKASQSCLVSLQSVQHLNSTQILMKNGNTVFVSRQFYSMLKEEINKRAVVV